HTLLDAREAEDALLSHLFLVIEIHLLVGTRRLAEAVAAAAVFVDGHDAVFFALLHGAARTRLHARRMRAVVAYTRQVEVKGVRILPCAFVFVPVRAPVRTTVLDLQVRVVALTAVVASLVVELPGFAELRPLRQPPRARLSVGRKAPAHLFPITRRATARHGVDRVPPHVLHAFVAGPKLLAGHRAGVTPETLVQVHHHGQLTLAHVVLRRLCLAIHDELVPAA